MCLKRDVLIHKMINQGATRRPKFFVRIVLFVSMYYSFLPLSLSYYMIY